MVFLVRLGVVGRLMRPWLDGRRGVSGGGGRGTLTTSPTTNDLRHDQCVRLSLNRLSRPAKSALILMPCADLAVLDRPFVVHFLVDTRTYRFVFAICDRA